MKKNKTSASVSDTVLQQIKHGKVTMRPRTYFVLLSIVSVVAITTASLVLAYCFSMLFFWTRIVASDTPAWGARANLSDAASNFPWWAVTVALAMFIIAVWLIKKQGHMYRYKTSVIIGGVAVVTLLVALVLSLLGVGVEHKSTERFNDSMRQPGWQRNIQ